MIDVKAIIEDGIVDAVEVAEIKAEMLADGVIDHDEVKILFEINDGVSGNANAPEWSDAFVDMISQSVLEDETSPGVIDEQEGDMLADFIEGDGVVDAVELALLKRLNAKATAIESDRLNELIKNNVLVTI